MSTLVIVESPAKAKTIEKYLGEGYTVLASVGHVRDLPKSNKNAIDIPGGFIPHYEVVPLKMKVLSELRDAVKRSSSVVLATDPDREGEAIAWHLAEALDLDPKNTRRVTFNEITKEAVTKAFTQPRVIDENLRKAQEARRVLDRLVGYDLSGLIWKKVRYGLSAGRVQSPALRIVMEREREIRAFVPEAFWVIVAQLVHGNDVRTFTCAEEPRVETEAERILALGSQHAWQVKDIKETEQNRSPYPPFTTSTLQQAASTRLGLAPSRTMAIAQKLYEAGHITYMRTDSPTLSKDALTMLAQAVEREFGTMYVDTKNFKAKSKNAQEAHEAIRPTNAIRAHVGATDEQKRLYELIRTRALASQMRPARVMRTRVTANIVSSDTIPDFALNGSRTLFDGWLKADPGARGEDVELPTYSVEESLVCAGITSEQKETTPPNRYTEAGLIKELEKRGIGRPSTYAAIMKNLVDRGYVEKQGKTLIPTDTGDVVSGFLEENFGQYISDSFTAEMENELDDIAEGAREYATVLGEFYAPFRAEVAKKDKESKKLTDLGPVALDVRCPVCEADMVYKLGRSGKFMSCSRYPECDGARTEGGATVEANAPIGTYPETDEPIFVLDGRFGPYVQVGNPKNAKSAGKGKQKQPKPKRASLPKGKDPASVTLDEALTYLSLPRALGMHPESGETITASVGRFGPYIVHQKDFRSLRTDDVYTITLERALEILQEPKKPARGRFAKKDA
ncbi:MAG: type I DNA topoisomerase [Candidatus Pacebacteria bacterium]|nr:type I DNA topoisomerase [Candidatus Paceibacterota bacterium]